MGQIAECFARLVVGLVSVRPLHTMNITRFIFCILLAASFLVGGCSASKPTPDPLAGYHWCSLVTLDSNKAISDDYRDYINKLPPEERKYVGPLQFFEDVSGQHAIMIEVALNGTDWAHVIFYDKNNKRVKAIKYVAGHYAS